MTGSPWLSEPEHRAWRSYLAMNRELTTALNSRNQREFGLSGADYEILVELSESATGRMRAFELGERTQWEKSRLSHHLTRMEKRGLVLRDNSGDCRYPDIVLTEQGRLAITKAAPDHAAYVRSLFFDSIDEDQVRVFGEVCDAVLAQLVNRADVNRADSAG